MSRPGPGCGFRHWIHADDRANGPGEKRAACKTLDVRRGENTRSFVVAHKDSRRAGGVLNTVKVARPAFPSHFRTYAPVPCTPR